MEKDTYCLKLQGKTESPERLEPDNNYHISLDGSIISETKATNEDGTFTYTATFRPVKIDVLEPKGKMLKLKDTRRMSQLFRNLCFKEWNNTEANIYEFDKVYEQTVYEAMSLMPQLVKGALTRIEK